MLKKTYFMVGSAQLGHKFFGVTFLRHIDLKMHSAKPSFIGKQKVEPTFHSRGVMPGDTRVPWHPQILADQLTLSQSGWIDYAHLITTGTPRFSDLSMAKHNKNVISPPNGLKSHSITQESIRSK